MASSEVMDFLQSRIHEGNSLLLRCSQLKGVQGTIKLKKKIEAELEFLSKLQKERKIRRENLKCSNLIHLQKLVDVATSFSGVSAVLQPFHSSERSERLVVDVVADEGRTWLKVIARNARALHLISLGQGQYGEKSILHHAENYLHYARANLVYYKSPSVKFVFFNGLPETLSKELEELGVTVQIEASSEAECSFNEENEVANDEKTNQGLCSTHFSPLLKLNLDITTMLAYVSSLTNGRCFFRFKEKILNIQASEERKSPVKPILDTFFAGRELVCCTTAFQGFEAIISTLGGPSEKERAKLLLEKIVVVPDSMSERTSNLELSSQIKERSKIIFGTGDQLQAITVTANTGFIRSAESQGIKLAVFIHASRALTENKQRTADVLSPEDTNKC